jgi:3-methyladenine DNA glycosylase AlkD
MTDNKTLKDKLKTQLAKLADKKTKLWWENYVKHDTKFRGVGIPHIRENLESWHKQESIAELPLDKQLDLALSFFEEEYAEDKLSGILFLQMYLYNKFDYEVLLSKFELLFQKEYIYDWNICDWFCVRVLGPMIKLNGVPCAKAISKWITAKSVWQARCSVVAFANLAKENKYTSLLLESNKILIKREERFAKTAVGWILRELSKVDEQIVVNFINANKEYFSKESLENSIKYFDKDKKLKMRGLLITYT